MIKHVVSNVERHLSPSDHWRVFYDVQGGPSDGTVHCHLFPVDSLAWRSAEYGIDPMDFDTLLDMVLHEPHMADHDGTSPTHLFNTDCTTARLAHLDRVDKVKQSVSIEDPDGLLERIRLSHRVDEADLATKARMVNHVRKHKSVPHRAVPYTTENSSG